ncbi:class I SAM-dependent methyltransferase [Phreatobacter aquaticus]|uniref:Class I SAM-dependent methyltransferase n=1 Tax=Phreatobacter aquaticus TaxID=2570229 RepID=A0A4D7QH99_9HYPH|nr:class I SAM-dependent methyltransferase [Phreatobacter aquaticus]QCK86265.1 class I SAM-dependent methyltransferase [Phreatobacter aquaticus]
MTVGLNASTAGYAEEADRLAVQYESIAFADVHALVLPFFPATPADVLDVGAGTGRDAAALAALGHRLVAAEPTAELRAHGERLHAAHPIVWLDDGLPDLAGTRALGRRFDLILLTAVLMHLDEGDRQTAMAVLAGLLKPGGRLILSLRHGPVPPGRQMFDVPADEVTAVGRRHGLVERHRATRGDMFDRGGVSWSHLVLETPVGGAM